MTQTAELSTLHRRIDELRTAVGSIRVRYGDIPAVLRLLGDLDRFDVDAGELDEVTPPPGTTTVPPEDVQLIDDRPFDPSLWADADDEGLGGYRGISAR